MGDSGPQLVGLEKLFNNPKAYNVLPYKHKYTSDNEYVYTGYFIPSWVTVMSCMDKRGYVKEEDGKDHYNKKRESAKSDMTSYIDFCSEYCYYPEEALSKQGENNFNQELLNEQYIDVSILKKHPEPEKGRLQPIYGSDDKTIIDVKWVKDDKGDIIIIEHPIYQNGFPIKNLYVAGIDGIDHGEEDSVVKNSGSKFCVAVKKRSYGIGQGDKYVAYYLKRPKDVRQAYIDALKMLIYYGCKANLEDTKIGFRTWLRERVKNEENYLMKRPDYALSSNRGKRNTLWGTPGSQKNILHGLDLVETFVNDNWFTITWLPVLEQMKKFSYEAKGRFDIIMAMVYAEIADEDMYNTKIVSTKDSVRSNWDKKKIGKYIDDNGCVRWGVQDIEQPINNITINPYLGLELR